MQEMKAFIDTQLSYNNINVEEIKICKMFLQKTMSLMEKEKKQIEDAYDAGSGYDLDWEAEQLYYKETYKK